MLNQHNTISFSWFLVVIRDDEDDGFKIFSELSIAFPTGATYNDKSCYTWQYNDDNFQQGDRIFIYYIPARVEGNSVTTITVKDDEGYLLY